MVRRRGHPAAACLSLKLRGGDRRRRRCRVRPGRGQAAEGPLDVVGQCRHRPQPELQRPRGGEPEAAAGGLVPHRVGIRARRGRHQGRKLRREAGSDAMNRGAPGTVTSQSCPPCSSKWAVPRRVDHLPRLQAAPPTAPTVVLDAQLGRHHGRRLEEAIVLRRVRHRGVDVGRAAGGRAGVGRVLESNSVVSAVRDGRPVLHHDVLRGLLVVGEQEADLVLVVGDDLLEDLLGHPDLRARVVLAVGRAREVVLDVRPHRARRVEDQSRSAGPSARAPRAGPGRRRSPSWPPGPGHPRARG